MGQMDIIPGNQRYDSFDVYRTHYKKIKDHEIQVGILIPKHLQAGPHPVFVRFHGGGCISGTWDYPNWFANWLVPLVHRNNAIVVSPNYRLLPEHTGADIQEDLADFWTWFKNGGVTDHLSSQENDTGAADIQLDYARVLAGGDSAGGYLAVQSGLTQPQGTVRAVLGCYPMTNFLRRKQQIDFMGEPAPPESIIDAHVKTITPGTTISGAPPRPRNRLSYALSAYGRYNEFFGTGAHLWPISLLDSYAPVSSATPATATSTAVAVDDKEQEQEEDAKRNIETVKPKPKSKLHYVPPTLIVHGNADTAVSIDDSRAFVRRVGEVVGADVVGKGNGDVRLVEIEGEDHGFDMDASEEKDEWVRDVVSWVEERWVR